MPLSASTNDGNTNDENKVVQRSPVSSAGGLVDGGSMQSPNTSPPRPPPQIATSSNRRMPRILVDEANVRASDEWIKDPMINSHFSALFDELAPTNHVIGQSMQELSKELSGFDTRYAEGDLAAPQPVSSIRTLSSGQRQQAFMCVYCHKPHDRIARARDCRYKDLGLFPYACEGECGDANCHAQYNSEERWRRHLERDDQCPLCGSTITVQNMARHRGVYCPNRLSE